MTETGRLQVLHHLFHRLWRHSDLGVERLIVNIYAASSASSNTDKYFLFGCKICEYPSMTNTVASVKMLICGFSF